MPTIIKYIREKKFYMESFYFTLNNGFVNKIINFSFLIKLLINFIIKFIIFLEISCKNKFSDQKKIFNISKKDDTCFIFGHGPSFKKIDLKKFKNKETFFVNSAHNHQDYKHCNPKYLCILDSLFFNPTSDGRVYTKKSTINKKRFIFIKEESKNINANVQNAKIILPYPQAYNSQKNFQFYNEKNLKYVKLLSHDIADYIPKNLSLNSGIPISNNVIPWVICLALVMNFKKIVLLSCEQNMTLGGSHAFIKSRKFVKNQTLSKLEPCSNYISLYYSAKILMAHTNLNNFAKYKKAQIINCTPDGILDLYKQDNVKNYY
jgi:hypothetical protein